VCIGIIIIIIAIVSAVYHSFPSPFGIIEGVPRDWVGGGVRGDPPSATPWFLRSIWVTLPPFSRGVGSAYFPKECRKWQWTKYLFKLDFLFTQILFNATEWALLFRDSGARYI